MGRIILFIIGSSEIPIVTIIWETKAISIRVYAKEMWDFQRTQIEDQWKQCYVLVLPVIPSHFTYLTFPYLTWKQLCMMKCIANFDRRMDIVLKENEHGFIEIWFLRLHLFTFFLIKCVQFLTTITAKTNKNSSLTCTMYDSPESVTISNHWIMSKFRFVSRWAKTCKASHGLLFAHTGIHLSK